MTSPLTIVSGYWIVTNKHGNKFLNWFKKSLKINCPYVFFGTKETIAIAKEHRGTLPTHYIELEMADFFTQRYRDDFQTDIEHCPSKELNMIWNEKLFLMQKAALLNPYKSDFFAWVDAGITNYRNKAPPTTVFPDPAKLKTLPKDKLIFSASGPAKFNVDQVNPTAYYHFISGTYMMHKSFIDMFVAEYVRYTNTLVPMRTTIFTDQVILTHMYKDKPELFHLLGHGYGYLLALLY